MKNSPHFRNHKIDGKKEKKKKKEKKNPTCTVTLK